MEDTNEMQKKEEQPAELQASAKGQPMTATSPFGLVRRFAEDMERVFEDFGDFRFPKVFGKEFFPFRTEKDVEWVPEIEVLQNNGQFTVRCDLPGMKKDDIKIELRDEVLSISGERNEEKKEESEGYYRSERNYGSFYRQVPLPAGVLGVKDEASQFKRAEKIMRGRGAELRTPENAADCERPGVGRLGAGKSRKGIAGVSTGA